MFRWKNTSKSPQIHHGHGVIGDGDVSRVLEGRHRSDMLESVHAHRGNKHCVMQKRHPCLKKCFLRSTCLWPSKVVLESKWTFMQNLKLFLSSSGEIMLCEVITTFDLCPPRSDQFTLEFQWMLYKDTIYCIVSCMFWDKYKYISVGHKLVHSRQVLTVNRGGSLLWGWKPFCLHVEISSVPRSVNLK